MKYEDIELSGSLDISGSFQVPYGPSSQMSNISNTSGSLFYNTESGSLYVWEGEWQLMGLQSAPAPPPPSADIEYLVVGGGGAGGHNAGGGGGAGGLLSSSLAVSSGSSFTITVGAGAAVNTGGAGDNGSDSSIAGSTITTVTATGGGGGGGREPSEYSGSDGGSGGGTSSDSNGFEGGAGTVGQGNDGGGSTGDALPGSGGGAGAAGATASDGGDGLQSSITGTSTYYAGGGGIGYSVTISNGGQGGGGTGINATDASAASTRAGDINTGGGGAGGYNSSGKKYGGAGGSGVVILAYDSGSINGAGGIVGDAGNGRKYHQFNQSGTFKVGNTTTDFDNIVTSSLSVNLDAGNFASRGTSTWTDLQGNYNGTINGSMSLPHFYYDFDGTNDYVQFATGMSSLFEGQSTFSVEFWCQIDSVGSGVLFAKYASNVQVGGYQFNINGSGQPNFFIANTSDQRLTANASTALSANTWTHLVYIFDGSKSITNGTGGRLQVYKDTIELSMTYGITTNHTTVPTTSTTGIKQNRLGIVNYSDGSAAYLAGKIAQFRYYSKVLTASEVLQNYNATKTNFV